MILVNRKCNGQVSISIEKFTMIHYRNLNHWGATIIEMSPIKTRIREIVLPVIHDSRGDLTFVEGQNQIPFKISRVYYLYNVPTDSERGGHAHIELEQVIFALSGSFRLTVNDGICKTEYHLRDPSKGIYLNKLTWREMDCFSQGAVCMVLASKPFDEDDYIRDKEDFLKLFGCS